MSATTRRAASACCGVLLTLISACATPGSAPGPAVDIPSTRARAVTEMAVPLAVFVEHRRNRPAPFDWSSDGCSNSPDHPMGFDFTAACWRHDFGYRNFLHGLGLDPTRERKATIDARLAEDLDTVCQRHTWWRKLCAQVARVYVWAVRVAGH